MGKFGKLRERQWVVGNCFVKAKDNASKSGKVVLRDSDSVNLGSNPSPPAKRNKGLAERLGPFLLSSGRILGGGASSGPGHKFYQEFMSAHLQRLLPGLAVSVANSSNQIQASLPPKRPEKRGPNDGEERSESVTTLVRIRPGKIDIKLSTQSHGKNHRRDALVLIQFGR
jgi:hypothetical protein